MRRSKAIIRRALHRAARINRRREDAAGAGLPQEVIER
jgi:hypothetical protein